MFRSLTNLLMVCSMLAVTYKPAQARDLASIIVVKTTMPFERFLEGSVEAISRATVSA
ncbi:hypothetical protein [Neptunomonas qingdaonensis]|uniref:Uncharacterized protein n=1 Tax=Neptunomonas qingdaonensis TaxID=1045558 RepID=A0A1I2TD96_9GAMM|nr:hypothetical protein [Neptunomonas qingdaonensis]SFG60251.1 hypothetical protein SAMN05216175_10998 [Neptunomonas qingdaonensis]